MGIYRRMAMRAGGQERLPRCSPSSHDSVAQFCRAGTSASKQSGPICWGEGAERFDRRVQARVSKTERMRAVDQKRGPVVRAVVAVMSKNELSASEELD